MEQNAEFLLGLGFSKPQFKTIRLDNGDDIKGANATGDFVYKTGLQESGFTRESFGKTLKGVVLMQRSKIRSTESQDSWWSEEFNSLNTYGKIRIHKGREVAEMTYADVKKAYPPTRGRSGQPKNSFQFQIILYLSLDRDKDKTIKLLLAGKSMGNWIKFRNSLNRSLLENELIITAIKNKENDHYEATFQLGEPMDYTQNKDKAMGLYNKLSNKSIEAPEAKEITSKNEEIPVIDEDEEEIKIEDVPF